MMVTTSSSKKLPCTGQVLGFSMHSFYAGFQRCPIHFIIKLLFYPTIFRVSNEVGKVILCPIFNAHDLFRSACPSSPTWTDLTHCIVDCPYHNKVGPKKIQFGIETSNKSWINVCWTVMESIFKALFRLAGA